MESQVEQFHIIISFKIHFSNLIRDTPIAQIIGFQTLMKVPQHPLCCSKKSLSQSSQEVTNANTLLNSNWNNVQDEHLIQKFKWSRVGIERATFCTD